jgi:hypothetical protein
LSAERSGHQHLRRLTGSNKSPFRLNEFSGRYISKLMQLVLGALRGRDIFSRMFRFNSGSSCHLSSSVEDLRCFPHIKPRSDHIAAREDLQDRWDTDLGRSGSEAQIDIVLHVLSTWAREPGPENDYLGRLHAESAVGRDKASSIATRKSPSNQQLWYLSHLRHRFSWIFHRHFARRYPRTSWQSHCALSLPPLNTGYVWFAWRTNSKWVVVRERVSTYSYCHEKAV